MAPFPCPSTSRSNLVPRSTLNRNTAALHNSLLFRHLPLAIPLPQSPHSHLRFLRMSGSPCNLAPIGSFSGVPFPMFPNFPDRSQPAPFRSWTSSRRRAHHPVLEMACVLPAERALVRQVSLVPHVNPVRTVSSALNVNLAHQIVPSVIRESQVLASASPPL